MSLVYKDSDFFRLLDSYNSLISKDNWSSCNNNKKGIIVSINNYKEAALKFVRNQNYLIPAMEDDPAFFR